MNTEEYRNAITRTIAPNYNPNVGIDWAEQDLSDVISIGEDIDKLKRALFYKDKGPSEPAIENLPNLSIEKIQLLHGIIGLIGEAAELAEVAIDIVNGKEVDKINTVEEAGDCTWYLDLILRSLGVPFTAALEANVRKLSVRYPDNFSMENRLKVDKQSEREAIEGALSQAG